MCKFTKNSNKRIDPCIRDYIHFIVKLGLIPRASCCGHKKYSKSIIIERTNIKRDIEYYELISGIKIPRTKRFYKKDKQGYYYIPELLEFNNKDAIKEQTSNSK